MSGRLVLCGIHIGNPEDTSARVGQILAQADLIAAEDTRSAALLLQSHGLRKELLSFYDHNERGRTPQIIERLRQGQTIALLSEAGMPLISDPGYHLVKAAREQNLAVEVIPGPSALITALAASGLPTDSFIFAGFLAAKPARRQKELQALAAERRTLIFYEAPHRIVETLTDIAALLPARLCFVAREMTKKYQEYLRGTAAEILDRLPAPKGEFVIVLAGDQAPAATLAPELTALALELRQAGLTSARVSQILARVFGLSKNQLKKILY